MPVKPKHRVSITRMTQDGGYIYAGCEHLSGEATFSPTYIHCYFEGRTLKKIKGGSRGGNYAGVDDGEVYRVMKFEKL